VKVLIATNGSAVAERALEEAARLLPLPSCEVVLVSVLDPTLRVGANEDANEDLARGVARLARHGVSARTVSRRGDFAAEIVATATAERADLLVLGYPPHSRLVEALTGSVTTEVLRNWRGAMLVIPSA
jgi:nucleotide-binding universal stress UspA family protein